MNLTPKMCRAVIIDWQRATIRSIAMRNALIDAAIFEELTGDCRSFAAGGFALPSRAERIKQAAHNSMFMFEGVVPCQT